MRRYTLFVSGRETGGALTGIGLPLRPIYDYKGRMIAMIDKSVIAEVYRMLGETVTITEASLSEEEVLEGAYVATLRTIDLDPNIFQAGSDESQDWPDVIVTE
jgi:hypothetical protein